MNCRLFVAPVAAALLVLFILAESHLSTEQGASARAATQGGWSTTTPLPQAFGHSPAVIYNGRVYLVGGEGPSGQIRNTAYYASLEAGSVGAWAATTPLPVARHYHALVRVRSYLYVVGGEPATDTVYFAGINADGSVNGWSMTTALPVPLTRPITVMANNRLYVIGGSTGASSQATVYYTAVNANGSLAAWNTTTSLPQALSFGGAAVSGGYIYVAGGYIDSGYTDAVYSAAINADGTLGNWNALPALPVVLGNHTVRQDDSHLYVLGGWDGFASQQAVYYAPFHVNGGLGSWQRTDDLPQPLHDHATAANQNYLYVFGGFNHSALAYQNSVYASRFIFTSCAEVTEIPQAECQALVALYNSTDGANWTLNNDWLATNAPCHWRHIACLDNHVTELLMANNQLNGTLPFQLGNLAELRAFELSSNQLSGAIPAELGNLLKLTRLELDSNQLSGAIPTELGNLADLDRLDLHQNQLSGEIPAELGNLAKLTRLYLSDNQLSGPIPLQLLNLSNLSVLSLESNQLTGSIPVGLGNLSKLTIVRFSNNQFSGPIPPELGNLTNLNRLNLGGNQLSGALPPELGNLSKLADLYLNNNQLSGPLPLQLGNLISLTHLYLNDNQFSEALPASLTNLTNLDLFWFHNTAVCEPTDAAFQAWLVNVADLQGTGVVCTSVQFNTATYAVNENEGTATIEVNLSGPSTQSIQVDYASSPGSAVVGSDYTAVSETLSFTPGETSKSFTIPVVGDTLDEDDETVNLSLSNSENAMLGALASAVLTIDDDDPAPTVQFSLPNYAVGENEGAATITVTLNTASGKSIMVNYATSDGSAKGATDFTATSGQLTFQPGEINKMFTFAIVDDALDEAPETISVALSNPANATLGTPANATVTLGDNDPAPTVQFGEAGYSVNENGGSATIQVTLDVVSGQSVSVNYATGDGSASAGSDYTAANAMLTFTPGQSNQTFAVTILDDATDESDETVNLTLSAPTNATLGGRASATLTIMDNENPLPPNAAFSGSPTTGVIPLTVNFIDQSTGPIANWLWDFGDGATSTEQNPVHAYTAVGDFSVSLMVNGPGGSNTKVAANYIHATQPPLPATPILNPIANADLDGNYAVSWGSVADATSYELQEQRNSGGWGTVYAGASARYEVVGNVDGAWCYQARSVNAQGKSAWSNSECATVSTASPLPTLSLPDRVLTARGGTVRLPVSYQANGATVSSLLFSVDYDQSQLGFTATDGNSDGFPDAIQFSSSLPASFLKSVAFEASDTGGELDVMVADFAALPKVVPNGVLLTIVFEVISASSVAVEAPVKFAETSFGSVSGDLLGIREHGSVLIAGQPVSILVTAAPATLPANGVSTSIISVVVKDGAGNPVPNQAVTFITTMGAIPSLATTDSNGMVTAALTAATTGGTATITASAGAVSGSVQVKFMVEPPTPTLTPVPVPTSTPTPGIFLPMVQR